MAEAAAAAARYGSLAYWRAAAPQALETPVEWCGAACGGAFLHGRCCVLHVLHADGTPMGTGFTLTPTTRYADYEALKPLLARQLAYGDNILVVGPGQSALHERLYERCVECRMCALLKAGCIWAPARARCTSGCMKGMWSAACVRSSMLHAAHTQGVGPCQLQGSNTHVGSLTWQVRCSQWACASANASRLLPPQRLPRPDRGRRLRGRAAAVARARS